MTILRSLRNADPLSDDFFFRSLNENLGNSKTKVEVTWLGKRVIKINDENGNVSLNDIANKVVAEIRDNWDSHNDEDFKSVDDVVLCLKKFYKMTDDEIAQSFFFVKICAAIQDFAILWMRDPKSDIDLLSCRGYYRDVYMELSGWW